MCNQKTGEMAGSDMLKTCFILFCWPSLIKFYTTGGKIKKEQSRREHQGNELWWDFEF